ncbi:MAG: TIGR01212 family radical SAM protein [Deltaproteobacteria bacterium]|nr:TIGR01212 family radical SAM protein [Deltaproteobacteria bacterium]
MMRYRDYNMYLREIFGERVQKIPLDAGLSCPNRDGTLSKEGCVFCDRLGSGTGAFVEKGYPVRDQIKQGRSHMRRRYKVKKFIAYFQSFTNTYAPLPTLKAMYDEALLYSDIVGLSVATRPDCIDADILRLLSSYRDRALVWIEYGLQSAHDKTLKRINRGHDVACFQRAVLQARKWDLNVCAHVILGLPGETREMMLETARFLACLPVQGVKIHLLYVTRGTFLAKQYERGAFQCLEREEYVDMVVDFLELLPPQMVVQRLTGDPGRADLLAPAWAREKTKNLNLIRKKLEERDTQQGKKYTPSR